ACVFSVRCAGDCRELFSFPTRRSSDLAYVDIYDSDLISDVYGVEIDFVNNKFTRLAGAVGKTPGADFDSINAFGGRRRCNLADRSEEHTSELQSRENLVCSLLLEKKRN